MPSSCQSDLPARASEQAILGELPALQRAEQDADHHRSGEADADAGAEGAGDGADVEPQVGATAARNLGDRSRRGGVVFHV